MGLLSRRRRIYVNGYKNLTFDILSSGNILWSRYNTEEGKTIQYRKNGGVWNTITAGAEGDVVIPVVAGDKLEFIGNNSAYCVYEIVNNESIHRYSSFSNSTASFNISGHICSLIGGVDSLTEIYTFAHLFDSTDVVSAVNLIVANNTIRGCYISLFQNCTSLINSPVLPATATYACYYKMFYGCSNLITAPALPSITLGEYCYGYMFSDCSSLTIAPNLPATTAQKYCYQRMFNGCSSLTTAPVISATTMADYCCEYMFNRCSSLVNAPALPATTLAKYCYRQMFGYCTSLVVAPALNATTLVAYCYRYMFSDCTALTTPPTLSATTLVEGCYYYMFENCTSLTVAPDLKAKTLKTKCYHHMFDGCSSLNSIKALFTTTPSTSYTESWLNGVAASGTFYKYTSASWTTRGVNAVPNNWTITKVSS